MPVLHLSWTCGISIPAFLDALKQCTDISEDVKDAEHCDEQGDLRATSPAAADKEHATNKATCAPSPAAAETAPLKRGPYIAGPNMGPLPVAQAPSGPTSLQQPSGPKKRTLSQQPSGPTSLPLPDITWQTDMQNLNPAHAEYEQRTKWQNIPEKAFTRLLNDSVLTSLTAQKVERIRAPRGFRAGPLTRTQDYAAQDYEAPVHRPWFTGACAADQGEALAEASAPAPDVPSIGGAGATAW